MSVDQFSKVNTHDADPDIGIAEHLLRISRKCLGHLNRLPEDFTYNILCERNTGLEAMRLYKFLRTKLAGLRMRFYMQKNDRGDSVAGFFLDKQKQDICTMMRDRVNDHGLRIASTFQPMCTAKETLHTGAYSSSSMLKSIDSELRNFEVKVKRNQKNPDIAPKLIYSGKKGYGFDDIIMALSENNFYYLSVILANENIVF